MADTKDYTGFSKEEYADILSKFLRDVDFYMPPFGYDFSLEAPVMEYFARQPWSKAHNEKAVKMAKWMSTGLGMCYPFAKKEVQVCYAIHAVYVLFIDDIVKELGDALDQFENRLVQGKPQASPVLQSLLEFVASNETYMGPYAGAMNTKATIEFVSGCMMERDFDGKITPPKGAVNFPDYFRVKTGYTEPYAHFCFPEELFPEATCLDTYLPALQDICEFTSYANDILSFYKESIVGDERLTYIPNIAHTHGISLPDAVRLVCANVTKNVQNVRVIFKDQPEMLRVCEEFFRGYIAWYINQARYKLTDIKIIDKEGKQFDLTPAAPKVSREEAEAMAKGNAEMTPAKISDEMPAPAMVAA